MTEGSQRKPIPRSSRGRQGGRKRGCKRPLGVVSTPIDPAPDTPPSKHETVVGESVKFNERTLIPIIWDYLMLSKNYRFVVPNVHVGKFESDVVGVDQDGYGHEYEIKTSRADFLRDFTAKTAKHNKLGKARTWQRSFTYVAPVGVIPLELLPPYASLVEIIYSPKFKHLRYCCRVECTVKRLPVVGVKPLHRNLLTSLAASLSRRFFANYKDAASHLGGCNFN